MSEPLRRYTGLFRTFAELPADRHAMLKFASKYGHRGEFVWVAGTAFDEAHERGATSSTARPTRAAGGARFAGREGPETPAPWKAQIESLRAAVSLWDLVRAGMADPDKRRQVSDAIG